MLEYIPVSTEQRRQFHDEGYLIIRGALDSETIGRLIEAGDCLIASDRRTNRQRNPDGLYDGFRNSVALDDAFVPLIDHPRVLPLIIQLLGSNLQLSTSHLIYRYPDPPGTSPEYRQPGWHRDNGRTSLDLGQAHYPRMGLKCAYYLTDLSEPNMGATMFSPGSNQLKERIEIPPDRVDPANAVEPLLAPGDCVIFEYRTWHAGAPNFSALTRKALMIGYCYQWLKPMDYVRQPRALLEKLDDTQRFLVGEAVNAPDDVGFKPSGGRNPLNDWCMAQGIETDRHGN